MKRYYAELFGTFSLVFAGTGAIVIDEVSSGAVTHVGVALTFGLVVMAMIYAVGDVPGAHLDPAVTLGFWVARHLPGSQVVPYLASQSVGAVIASLALHFLFPLNANLGRTFPAGLVSQSFFPELLLTCILMFVILSVATGAKERGITAGIAIGGVIALGAVFAGPICGASMNPARSLAPSLVSGHFGAFWIYLLAPILGALLGVFLCRTVRASAPDQRAAPVATMKPNSPAYD